MDCLLSLNLDFSPLYSPLTHLLQIEPLLVDDHHNHLQTTEKISHAVPNVCHLDYSLQGV